MKKNHIETYCKKYNSSNNTENLILFGMLGITLLSGALLTLSSALADDSVVTDVAITVPDVLLSGNHGEIDKWRAEHSSKAEE